MSDVSTHARQRAGERLHKAAYREADTLFPELWAQGRTATDGDLCAFRTIRVAGFDYRCAVRAHANFLIVRGATGTFVTLIKRGF